jgi:hypothetical protein
MLRPAYAVVADRLLRCVVLVIRGTHSMKDLFTSLAGAACAPRRHRRAACRLPFRRAAPHAATQHGIASSRCPPLGAGPLTCLPHVAAGAAKPHHVMDPGGGGGLVLGYSHLGMLAAARWLAKQAGPVLRAALAANPGYELRVVGEAGAQGRARRAGGRGPGGVTSRGAPRQMWRGRHAGPPVRRHCPSDCARSLSLPCPAL